MRKLRIAAAVLLSLFIPSAILMAADYSGAIGTERAFNDIVSALTAGTPAGTAYLGQVGSASSAVTVAQTVTASSAYTAGNAVGGKITLTGLAKTSTGGVLIQSVIVHSKSAQTTQMDLLLFNADPSGSTCTDKTAVAVAAADFDKWKATIHIVDWTSGGTPSSGQSHDTALFSMAAGTTAYGCLVTRSTPTFSATSDISVTVNAIQVN